MLVSVPGRVANMPLSPIRCLVPLYEAVVNSIQAIEQADRSGAGRIDIEVLRDPEQADLGGDFEGPAPVAGFRITDNGIGFDEENFEAFSTSDTTYKREAGGKGVGRFLWLKAFDRVSVRSVFAENGATLRREFLFTLQGDGVSEDSLVPAHGEAPKTVVELSGFRKDYQAECPRRLAKIADSVIEHCLEYLAPGSCPDIHIRDATEESVHLNRRFEEGLEASSSEDSFRVGGEEFRVRHLRLNGTGKHAIHFCANKRVVTTIERRLQRSITELPNRVPHEGRGFIYAAYVSGAYLDDHVNADRTGFTFPTTRDQQKAYGVCADDLEAAAVEQARSYLEPYISPVRESTFDRVQRYIETDAPHYRHLLTSAPDAIRSIPPGTTDDALDVELYQIAHDLDRKVREKARGIIESAQESDEHWADVDKVLADVSSASLSDLARYVVHRKLILELLDSSLGLKADGTYSREREVHRIIYPMGVTSDSPGAYEQQNLWIVDERLSYHSYLASDRPLASMQPVGGSSARRPDLAIFNKGLAYVEGGAPYSSVVIIELKRPVREQYDRDDNPLEQVYSYISEMRAGGKTDDHGRPLHVLRNASFYVYIIADLTEVLRRQADNANLWPTPDESGYFGFNATHRAYVEIISYSKLIGDAKKRNKILFEKLKLPPSAGR